jgi:oxaloacetate decarboxylase gamma subunit
MQPEVAEALAEAANLLLVGMTVVFLFLSMLIGAIHLIAWINKLIPDDELKDRYNSINFSRPDNVNHHGVSPKIVAAIGAAIRQHRRTD